MADKPLYQTEQDDRTIRQRMLAAMPDRYDKSEGGFAYDTMAPIAVELAKAGVQVQRAAEIAFEPTGAWVDLALAEAGLERKEAFAAVGTVTFTGTAGLVIEKDRRVSTASVASQAAALFATDAELTLDGTGHGTVGITAVTPGAAGNVAAGTVAFMAPPIPGVTALSNAQATTGGLNSESDPEAWERLKDKRRNPSAGGNAADYRRWALEVPGVGGAAVVPVRDGAGTVSVAVIGVDKLPASPALVQAVQDYIAPPWRIPVQAETFTLSGFGASIDNTRSDDTGDSVKMVYNAGGNADATHVALQNVIINQPGLTSWKAGVWQARVRVLGAPGAGASVIVLTVGVWNASLAAWAKASAVGSADARKFYMKDDLPATFGEVVVEFYWDGGFQFDLIVERRATDTSATTIWVDQVEYRSTFSRVTGNGLAPIGARVTAEAAQAVAITISAALVIQAGYDGASVRTAVQNALADYIKQLAFQPDNDVRYGRVVTTMLDVPGVQDYSNLLVNGASTNVVVGDQQVAVLGTVTLS